MTARRCTVRFTDENGIEHRVEVLAESVYEAAALALRSFNADPFIHDKPTERSALKVCVIAPSAEHALRVEQLRRWVEKASRSPAEKLARNRIRSLLGMSN
ncbi:MAG: hypothetical protein WBQ79_15660 [Acidobacteriaceae bacterium]